MTGPQELKGGHSLITIPVDVLIAEVNHYLLSFDGVEQKVVFCSTPSCQFFLPHSLYAVLSPLLRPITVELEKGGVQERAQHTALPMLWVSMQEPGIAHLL